MDQALELITGEFRRVYDDRYRISLPPELINPVVGEGDECVIAKEREGCLSLWNSELWKKKIDGGVALIRHKLQLDLFQRDFQQVQRFTRLLSTRSRAVKFGQRGRLLVPEGFREFLGVEPNSEVMVVGAGVCVEIWSPPIWNAYLREDIGEFHNLFKDMVS